MSGQYRASYKQESIFSNFHAGISPCRPKIKLGSHVKDLSFVFLWLKLLSKLKILSTIHSQYLVILCLFGYGGKLF